MDYSNYLISNSVLFPRSLAVTASDIQGAVSNFFSSNMQKASYSMQRATTQLSNYFNPQPLRPLSYSQESFVVNKINDADTIQGYYESDTSKKIVTIRVGLIDAPEIPHTIDEENSKNKIDIDHFKWGKKATKHVEELLKREGNKVSILRLDRDNYGREVSLVRLKPTPNNKNYTLHESLLEKGYA